MRMDLGRRTYRLANPLALIAALTLAWAAPAAAQRPSQPNTAQLTTGQAQGVLSADRAVASFKGLPFAAPPVGPLRWAAPQPPAAWTGVRQASEFGPECSQPRGRGQDFERTGEDCLYLNVWAPTKTMKAGGKLAVLVWFYGGGFVGGGSSVPKYDGDALARRDIVVVTANYRTGVMGYLAHPLLTKANGFAGNMALLDEIAVLEWVKANIAAFGGDPTQVTVAGHSSGALIVDDLMVAPKARGLFSKAIVMSGPMFGLTVPMRSREQAETFGAFFMQNRGATTLEQMRALPEDVLLVRRPEESAVQGPPHFKPIYDHLLIPRRPWDIFKAGEQAPVPMLIGSTLDEFATVTQDQSAREYADWAVAEYGARSAEVLLKAFPAGDDARKARVRLKAFSIHEGGLAQGQMHAKAGNPVWLYRFDRAPPGPDAARNGSMHGDELPYMFANLDKVDIPWTDQDRRLSQQMSDYWVNFIKTGDPNGGSLKSWPRMDPSKPEMLVLDTELSLTSAGDPTVLKAARRLYDPAIAP